MALPLHEESWIWYALAMFFILCRILSRFMLFGNLKHLKVDDWLMIVIIVPYTVLIVTINIVSHTSSNLLEPGADLSDMSLAERQERIYGSKLILVVEQMQIATIWTVKACLLILYHRLTQNLTAHIFVKVLSAFVVFGYILMEILYFGVWCRPFSNYWALPTTYQCSAATHHLIVNAVLNLSSDTAMLIIAGALFIRSKLSLSRKIIVFGIFGIGIFVILAAVLNKYYSFTHPFGSEWTYWYVRESSTAILVANLPFFWTLIRRVFKLKSFHGSTTDDHPVPYHSSRSARGRHAHPTSPGQRSSLAQSAHQRTWNGSFREKRPSDSSDIDIKLKIPVSAFTSSPTSPIRPALVLHRPSWREQGVYGRFDAELMSDVDPWDSGATNDVERGMGILPNNSESSNSQSEPNFHSASSLTPILPRRDGGSSPTARRLRDHDRQLKMQEEIGRNFQYHVARPDSDSEKGMEEAIPELEEPAEFEQMSIDFHTSALDSPHLPDSVPGADGPDPAVAAADGRVSSDRRRSRSLIRGIRRLSGASDHNRKSLADKIAPPLWS